jgi:sirohydrochlorin cobaltochelatase
VGTHPRIRGIILASAQQAVAERPFPRAPVPAETALFVAGHGTEKHAQSRLAAEDHAQAIRAQGEYADAHAVFLEEPPLIGACYDMTAMKNIVMVPLFIGEGSHVIEDLPVCLGESRERVQIRLAAGRAVWPNPQERRGKRVWLTPSVGSHPELIEVILDRVREFGVAD